MKEISLHWETEMVVVVVVVVVDEEICGLPVMTSVLESTTSQSPAVQSPSVVVVFVEEEEVYHSPSLVTVHSLSVGSQLSQSASSNSPVVEDVVTCLEVTVPVVPKSSSIDSSWKSSQAPLVSHSLLVLLSQLPLVSHSGLLSQVKVYDSMFALDGSSASRL